jgi:rubrerythrin
MKAAQVYEGFIGFEERSAELYLELSVKFADDLALRWFWVDMAMEEKQHAGMLQHCREAGVFAKQLPGPRQVEKLEALFKQMEQRIAAPNLTLDDAFDCAIRLESSEINDIYSKLTAPIQGPAHVMRKKMELSVASHFKRLFEAARTSGASPDIQQRLARLLTCGRSAHELAPG